MALKNPNWRFIVAFAITVCICLLDGGLVSESPSVGENTRKMLYLLFLAAVLVTGYLYWKGQSPEWMKKIWVVAYGVVFLVLILINVLNGKFIQFSTTFLDQVRYFRLFFLSPLPFLLSVLLTKMDMKQGDTANEMQDKN